MAERDTLIQALRSCSRHQCGNCLFRGEGIACKQKLMEAAADELDTGFSRADALTTWGMLQTLKDILEGKAKAAAGQGGANGPQVAGRYLKTCAEISDIQSRICKEGE